MINLQLIILQLNNITRNGEKLKAFLLTSGMRQRYPLSPLLFSTVLEVAVITITQEKEIKGIQIGKEKVKLSLSACDMILYNILKTSPKNYQSSSVNQVKSQNTKLIYRNMLAFLHTNDELSEREVKKVIPFTMA